MSICESHIIQHEINRLNMYISTAAYADLGTEWCIQNLKASFTRVYYIIDGKAQIFCNGKQIDLLPGNIYVVPVGAEFSCRCDNHLEKLYFHLNFLRFNNYDYFEGIKDCIVLENRQADIEKMLIAFKKQDTESVLKIKVLLYEVLLDAIQTIGLKLGKAEDYSPLIQDVLNYIENHLQIGLTVEDIVADLYISPSKLQKQFRAEIGVPIGRYIHDQVMFSAERQLSLSDKSIKTISAEHGFCDQFYFSRCFKQKHGISPAAYRKTLLLHS